VKEIRTFSPIGCLMVIRLGKGGRVWKKRPKLTSGRTGTRQEREEKRANPIKINSEDNAANLGRL